VNALRLLFWGGLYGWTVAFLLAAMAFSSGCSGAPKSCARYGALEAEYGLALQEACGKLDDVECAEQRPEAVEKVDDRFSPQFIEAEKCQAQ
jgi:hypothetical protein